MKRKNSYLELLRFCMCIVILLHHSGLIGSADTVPLFPLGALAADFFFMITGYFSYAHLLKAEKLNKIPENAKMKYWILYSVRKIKRIFPYAAVGVISIYLLEFFEKNKQLSLGNKIMEFKYLPFELSFTHMLGIISPASPGFRNPSLWFISCILVVLPVVMFLISCYRDTMISYLIWFLPAILQNYLVKTVGSVCSWDQFAGFVYGGILRAFADFLMGCAIYVAARWLENYMKNKKAGWKLFLTMFESILLLFILYKFNHNLLPYDQILVLYVIAVMLVIVLSGTSYTSGIHGKALDFLGNLSMPIYCIQWAVYSYVSWFCSGMSFWKGVTVTLILCIGISVILVVLFSMLKKRKLR